MPVPVANGNGGGVVGERTSGRVPPNMRDYEDARAHFSWAEARADLAGLPGGCLNIAHEAVDRHLGGPAAMVVALRYLDKKGVTRDVTYAELARETDRFANVLRALGVEPGERVFVLAGRIPELYVAALGTLKHGSVFCAALLRVRPRTDRAAAATRATRACS